jgi:hypothetical protein
MRWEEVGIVAGISEEEFKQAAQEILGAWERAQTRDAGFEVIVNYGRKYGYKNVIAAIQGRLPKQFAKEKTNGKPIEQWVEERRAEEGVTPS